MTYRPILEMVHHSKVSIAIKWVAEFLLVEGPAFGLEKKKKEKQHLWNEIKQSTIK